MIVESPAKAKTIERYLGPGYTVLASYGHVRDLPGKPGKDKLGVDVEHDFAPTYEIVAGPAQPARRDREGGPQTPTSSTSPPTSTARARRSPGTSPRPIGLVPERHAARVTFNEITERAIREAFAHPRQIDLRPGRRPAGPPDRRPAGRLHAQPAALAQGPLGPVGRPGPVGRRAPGGRPRARDPGVHGRRVLDDRGRSCIAPDGSAVHGRARADRRRQAGDRRRRDGRAPRRGDPGQPARSSTRSPSSARSAARRRRSRPRPSSRRPAASSASARSGRCRSPSACTRASRRPTARSASSPTCGPTRSRSPGRRWARRARSSASATAAEYTMPKGRPFKTKTRRRPGGARGDPADLLPARPRRAGQGPGARRGPPVPADLAARPGQPDEGEGARDDDAPSWSAGSYGLRASATQTIFDGFSRGLHRGPGRRGRGGRARPCRRSPRATSRRSTTVDADPALHRAAAALHRGHPDQGARGARDRPAVDLRGHDLDDRRPGLRQGRWNAASTRSRSARS